MRNWKGEEKETRLVKRLRREAIKELEERKQYLITLEDSFLELVFDETMEDSYDELYLKFCYNYNIALDALNQRFNNIFAELHTYFEDNYKPISPRYERICN